MILFSCLSEAAQTTPANGNLSLKNSQYVSSGQNYFRDAASGENSSVSLLVDLDQKWKKLSLNSNLKNEYSTTEEWNYLDVYELSATYTLSEQTALTAGRHLETWNAWEKDWQQGIFQPRYMQNRARPEFAGLTGLFYTQKQKTTSFTVGVLPIYIPEFGAHFYVRDNKFYSENPWFNPPASQFVFRQEVSDIHYSLDKPDSWDVISNPGIVAKLEWKAGAYSGRLSGAYKPIQQLLLGFPSEKRVIVGAETDYMLLEVKPRVAYQRVANLDSAFQAGPWLLQNSLMFENPLDSAPAEYTAQAVDPAFVVVFAASRPLETEGPYAARVSLGYLKVDGANARDTGEFASQKALFENRYQFREALRVGLTKPWRGIFRFPLETEAMALYDREQNGGLFRLSSSLNVSRELRVSLEMDFIGLLGTDADPKGGFLSTYRANDRIGMGMSYVF